MALSVAVKEKLKRYQHRDATEEDCVNALTAFNSLAAESELYRYQNGPSVQLVRLKGTIPVQFKGNVYNIPICIWLQEKHPYIPPIVFVMPTATMVIKQGKHVDTSGRVYLPFLHEWKYPGSDLYGLLQVLCFTFGEEPPVYSRAAAPQRPSHAPYPGYSGSSGAAPNRPYPGYPGSNPQTSMPPGSQGMSMPVPYGGSSGPGYPASTASGMPAPYPPAGGHPAQSTYQGSQRPPYPPGPGSSQPHYSVGSSSSQPPYPAASSSQTPYPSGSSYGPPATSSFPGGMSGYPSYSNTETYTGSSSNAYGRTNQQAPNKRQDSLPDDTIKESLRYAVEEKLSRRVKEVYELAKSEIDGITSTKEQLQNGSRALNDIQQKISDETTTIENSNQILEQKNQELRDMIAKMENNAENLNIDEAVVTTAPLYNQILELFAEENAVEDAIYFLGEALRREVLELDAFLKAVRKLSRKMFMLRAQLQKARETAGLG